MIAAVEAKKEMNESNTAVIVNRHGVFVRLYDTFIFALVRGRRYYSDGGWNTVTTASRLNALGCGYGWRKNTGPVSGSKLRTQNEMINLFWSGNLSASEF